MSTETTHQSHWGFHPCEYALYRKLKTLHRWYWQTVYDFHRWRRWQRKEPQNRRGARPNFCPLFVLNQVWLKPVRVHGVTGHRRFEKTLTDRGIVALYELSRRPSIQPVESFDDATRRQIDSLFEKASSYFRE